MDTINFCSVLPLLGFIDMTISSGTTIYYAYNNGDAPMIVFITFIFFGTFLLDYWFRLYHMLPPCEQHAKKLKLKIGIWVLLSAIMLGFACEFSTFISFTKSLSFFAVVIGGNSLLFYVYFVWNWEGHKSSGSTCLITSGGKIREARCYVSENANEKEHRPLTKSEDNV